MTQMRRQFGEVTRAPWPTACRQTIAGPCPVTVTVVLVPGDIYLLLRVRSPARASVRLHVIKVTIGDINITLTARHRQQRRHDGDSGIGGARLKRHRRQSRSSGGPEFGGVRYSCTDTNQIRRGWPSAPQTFYRHFRDKLDCRHLSPLEDRRGRRRQRAGGEGTQHVAHGPTPSSLNHRAWSSVPPLAAPTARGKRGGAARRRRKAAGAKSRTPFVWPAPATKKPWRRCCSRSNGWSGRHRRRREIADLGLNETVAREALLRASDGAGGVRSPGAPSRTAALVRSGRWHVARAPT